MWRSVFIVFLAGWAIRFLIDKPPAGQLGLPEAGDSMLENFQQAFDMLKAGYLDMAYVFIWDAHYLVLSLLGGVLVSLLFGVVSERLGRRRMRRHFLPPARKDGPGPDKRGSTDMDAGSVDEN